MSNFIEEDCSTILNDFSHISFSGKRILITGSTGQIGSYFIVFFHLLKKFYPDLVIDAFFSTSIPSHLLQYQSSINFINVDLSRANAKRLRNRYDYIIYGAGYGQPVKFTQNKEATFLINSIGLINQLSLLNEQGKFIFLSTSEVYADNEVEFQTEKDVIFLNPNSSRSSYVVSKLFGEEVIKHYSIENNNFKIARVCLAYGPGTKATDTRVLNELIKQGIQSKKIKLLDFGLATRTYCYVLDSLKMLLSILFEGKSTVYNVGNPTSVTILQLANIIGKNCGISEIDLPNSRFKAVPDVRTQSPQRVSIKIDKFINEFGLPNFKSINDGILRTVDWQRSNLYRGDLI